MIDPAEFRRVMGHWASGVAVVTTRRPGPRPCGLTVSAVSSVSLSPTLVLVCVDRAAESHDCIAAAGVFAVNFLALDGGAEMARRFALRGGESKFEGVPWRAGESGSPLLDGALAWMDCRLAQAVPGGDHTIFLGEVLAAGARPGEPLVYYRGGFGSLAS